MKAILFLLSFLLIFDSFNLYSQETTGTIKGKVSFVKDKSPVDAELRLFVDGDSTYLKGTKTDSLGSFMFSDLKLGPYRIEITAIGYATKNIHGIKIQSPEPYLLDTIYLNKQDVTTEEINVEGEKSLITFEGDKKVFNVQESMVTKGGTALDVLRKVPLIDVDINDNVTLRGSTNAKILIDNKPNRYGSLKQIPSDAVEKIEILTNPPAKYEAEGVTGIINIVLKKIDKPGFNGDISLNLGSKDKYYGYTDLNLRLRKLTFYGSLYGGLYHYQNNMTSLTTYAVPLNYLQYNSNGGGKSNYFGATGGVEYEPVTGHTVGIEVYPSRSGFDGSVNSTSTNLDLNSLLTSYFLSADSYSGDYNSISASLYYNGKLNDKGRELNSDLTYSHIGNEYGNNSINRYFDGSGNPTIPNLGQNTNTNNKSDNVNLQIDYTHPFAGKTKFEAGYKGTYRLNDNDYSSDTLDYNTGGYIQDYGVSNRFKLTDAINAVYGTFQTGYGKFTAKLGLRLEQTNTKGELISGSSKFTKNYFNLFPSISLTQDIGQFNHLQFSFSRRITRPGIYRLNPFVVKSDQRFIYFGNPELNPEFTNSYELSFLYYSKVITVTPMVFFRQSFDLISSYNYVVDSNVTVRTYRNSAGLKAWGMDLILNSQTLGWVSLTATLSVYNTKVDADVVSDYNSEQGVSWKANIRSYFSFGKGFNFELYYNYSGTRFTAQEIIQPSSGLTIGIRQTLMKDKLTLSLSASDVFKTMQWASDVNGIGYTYSGKNTYESRVVYFGVSYRFGNTDEYYQKKKKVKQNQNENNDQQDSNGTGR